MSTGRYRHRRDRRGFGPQDIRPQTDDNEAVPLGRSHFAVAPAALGPDHENDLLRRVHTRIRHCLRERLTLSIENEARGPVVAGKGLGQVGRLRDNGWCHAASLLRGGGRDAGPATGALSRSGREPTIASGGQKGHDRGYPYFGCLLDRPFETRELDE